MPSARFATLVAVSATLFWAQSAQAARASAAGPTTAAVAFAKPVPAPKFKRDPIPFGADRKRQMRTTRAVIMVITR